MLITRHIQAQIDFFFLKKKKNIISHEENKI